MTNLFDDMVIKTQPVQTGNSQPSIKTQNNLERTPNKDSFVVQTNEQQNEIQQQPVIQTPIPIKKPDKSTIIIGGAGLAIAATVAVASGIKTGKLQKELANLATDNQTLKNQITELTGEKGILNDKIKELQDALDKILSRPSNFDGLDKIKAQFEEIISARKIDYDFLQAPYQLKRPYTYEHPTVFKGITPDKITDLVAVPNKTTTFTLIDDLKQKFSSSGKLELTIPELGQIKPVKSNKAFIGTRDIEGLGKTTKTMLKLEYGKRANWSEQKIARDIMQNFYDGHGNTLDGVKVLLEKQADGKTKVKVFGKGLYEPELLQYLGSGNKLQDAANAGGFGEGSKVLVASLLGKGHTDSVKYACADWELIFGHNGDIVTSTLNKVQNTLEGNSIEFVTGDKKIIDSIMESINYFRHSSNPDFKDMDFLSDSFGFKILKNGEKGNLYLTQRFEYDKPETWENAVEDLTLFFAKKPDPKKFLEITGENFAQVRDRTQLTTSDIKNLTRYFASEMADDELLSAVKRTMPLWQDIQLDPETKKPLKAFISALGDEMKKRNIYIDMTDLKFAEVSGANDTVKEYIRSYGYKILPEEFQKLGMYSARDIFSNLSQHKPLMPTANEIQKIKILDEAISVIKEDIDSTLRKHLSSANLNFDANSVVDNSFYLVKTIKALCSENSEIKKLLLDEYGSFYSSNIKKLSDEEKNLVAKNISEFINKKLKSINPQISQADKEIFEEICNFGNSLKDPMQRDFFKTINVLRLIEDVDIHKPRYIFDRHSEIAKDTLGEALGGKGKYDGHWIDREYLNKTGFSNLLGTWLHEICHKSGGDGTAEFTYTLTDMIRVLLQTSTENTSSAKLKALQKMFEEIQ